jgi:sulfur-oxidizing protein SoxY
MNRRQWLRAAVRYSAATAVLLSPLRVLANIRQAFDATSVDDALKGVVGDKPVLESDLIKFKIPDIAENGAVVPVSVSTQIDGVSAISIVIENNPNPLTTRFEISPAVVADVSTRVKMGQTSVVRVYVETPDTIFTTAKEVKVTIGGCGG